jgi:tripartite-type tricarboxylate transporter receptor subunit TctC
MELFRKLQGTALVAMLLLAGIASLQADEYPSRPIHLLIPWSPGGTNDLIGRLVGDQLAKSLGQPVVVENKPGASGIIGAREVVRAVPDGYTLLLTSNSLTLNSVMHPDTLGFDVLKDLDPVALAANSTSALVVNASLSVKSANELVALCRKKPGYLTAGTAGSGAPSDFLLRNFQARTGIDVVAVPYKAAPQIWLDLLSGQISFAFINLQQLVSQTTNPSIGILAVTSTKRSSLLPDVPTLKEAGIAGVVEDHWMGYFAPARTPGYITNRLAAAINAALVMPQISSALAMQGMKADGESTPASFAEYLKKDIETHRDLIKSFDSTAK